jgi:hypothetical protein
MQRHHPTHNIVLRRVLLVFAIAVGVVSLGGCDTATSPQSSDDQARIGTSEKVVIESSGFTRADLRFEPISVSAGETFSINLTDNEKGSVTQITHEGTQEGRHIIKAQFDPLNPASVDVKCKNINEGEEKMMATLNAGGLSKNGPTQVASTTYDPSSWHYYEDNKTVFVEVDYGGTAPGSMFNFPSSDEPVECTHVSFALQGVSTPFSADGVQFRGIDEAPAFKQRQFQ